MPLRRTTVNGKPAFQYGERGKKYVYTAGDPESRKRAKKRAIKQAMAISHRTGMAAHL
jgi:hypothetical protein